MVDKQNRPIGVITQGDMIKKGGLPLRLGLLAESDQNRLEVVLNRLASRKAADVMTAPAVMVAADRSLAEAAELTLSRDVKRLPVVDETGGLAGMLSRLDVFRTVMREAPDWNAFRAQHIEVAHLKRVGDILRRDVHTISPETPPFAADRDKCPFCAARLAANTPRIHPELWPQGRMTRSSSTLFPDLSPYGRYSAVRLFDDRHFVEIGTARLQSCADSFLNCRECRLRVLAHDPAAVYMAIPQKHKLFGKA